MKPYMPPNFANSTPSNGSQPRRESIAESDNVACAIGPFISGTPTHVPPRTRCTATRSRLQQCRIQRSLAFFGAQAVRG